MSVLDYAYSPPPRHPRNLLAKNSTSTSGSTFSATTHVTTAAAATTHATVHASEHETSHVHVTAEVHAHTQAHAHTTAHAHTQEHAHTPPPFCQRRSKQVPFSRIHSSCSSTSPTTSSAFRHPRVTKTPFIKAFKKPENAAAPTLPPPPTILTTTLTTLTTTTLMTTTKAFDPLISRLHPHSVVDQSSSRYNTRRIFP